MISLEECHKYVADVSEEHSEIESRVLRSALSNYSLSYVSDGLVRSQKRQSKKIHYGNH